MMVKYLSMFLVFFMMWQNVYAVEMVSKELVQPKDTFYDPTFDYSFFMGRVTDRDSKGHIFKIESQTKNTRLFRVGDKLEFLVNNSVVDERCKSYIRSVEKGHFVIYVPDIWPCWKKHDYFRRGTILRFFSSILLDRVKDASAHRLVLMKRKNDLFKQLNQVNHFLWSFEQKRISLAANYDKEILRLRRKKQEAVDDILITKEDKLKLQRKIVYYLDQIEKDLEFYRIEKKDQNLDRWYADNDLGLPVVKRPQGTVSTSADGTVSEVQNYRNRKKSSR